MSSGRGRVPICLSPTESVSALETDTRIIKFYIYIYIFFQRTDIQSHTHTCTPTLMRQHLNVLFSNYLPT